MRNDHAPDTRAPLRLRVPASLAVVLLGASTTLALSFGGCADDTTPAPGNDGQLTKYQDAGTADGDVDGSTADGSMQVVVDGGVDMPDAPPDAEIPPDAAEVPVDAYVPADVYVPPDTPDH